MYRHNSPVVALMTVALLISYPANATSIVILRSPDTIYVGADSRRTYREPGETYAGSVCKIVPAGRFIFVASGLTYFNGRRVAEIGVDAARNARSVRDAMEAFRHRLISFLPNALIAEAEIEPARDTQGNRLLLEAANLGFEQGKAEVILEWFRRDANGLLVSDRRIYDSPLPGRYDFIFAGKRREIDRYLANRSIAVRGDLDAIRFIRQTVDMEIADSPETTAAPIDILQMMANGRRWLQHKPGCEISPVR
ncbi:MAG TPA: hypothetical protein VG168_09510 [Bryobacteraceae bacterium]|nr:hypothetical protein [Bryobacteraceae bacterium]